MRIKKVEIILYYIERIVQALRVGATYELAALYAGISEDTLARWRKKAVHAAPESLLGQLRVRMMEAESNAAIGWLALVQHAAQNGEWRAACWLLSHRFPEAYGSSLQKVAFTSPDGQEPAQVALIALPSKAPTAEEWAEDVKALRERALAVNGTHAQDGGTHG
jgi:hypothetical protein